MTKNTFALSLVHEAVHLERPPEFFFTKTKQETIDEECRTWSKVDINAVRYLRQIGQPLDEDWIKADDILKRCNDEAANCPELAAFIEGVGDTTLARYPK